MTIHPLIQQHWRRFALELLLLAALAGALLAVLQFSATGADFFWTLENIQFLAAQAAPIALGALGMALVLLVGGIDLSAGASAALAGVVAAALLQKGTPFLPAFGSALLLGGALGALNGVLAGTCRNGPAPWALTLGTFGIAWGAARWFGGGAPIPIPATAIGALRGMNLAFALVLVLALAALFALLSRYSVFGRHVRAIGSNEEAARLCGVRVGLTKWLVYTVAGLLFAAAGLILMAVASQGDLRAGLNLELAFAAAALLGGVGLGGGTGGALGAFVGALALTVLHNATAQAGWPVPLQEIGLGGLLIAAVGINRLRHGPGGEKR